MELAKTALAQDPIEEIDITSTQSGDVCNVDNSCNTTTTATESQPEKVNISEKWKYNISEGGSLPNDTIVEVYKLNETNTTINLGSGAAGNVANESAQTNETKSTNTKFGIRVEERCLCDLKVSLG